MNIGNEVKKRIRDELTSNSELIHEDGLHVLIVTEFERYLKNIDFSSIDFPKRRTSTIKLLFSNIYYTIMFNKYLITDEKEHIDLSYYKNELFKLIIYSRSHDYDNFFKLVEEEIKRQAPFEINLRNMISFLNLMIDRYII